MSTLSDALPGNRTALENALLKVEDTAREFLDVCSATDAEVSAAVAFPLLRLRDAIRALDELRDAIRKGERA